MQGIFPDTLNADKNIAFYQVVFFCIVEGNNVCQGVVRKVFKVDSVQVGIAAKDIIDFTRLMMALMNYLKDPGFQLPGLWYFEGNILYKKVDLRHWPYKKPIRHCGLYQKN